MQALVDIDAAVAQGGDGVDEDINFHRTIAEASGDPYILSVLTFVGQYFRSGTRVTRANGARRRLRPPSARRASRCSCRN
jgi:GntR family transcriptional repressor for pyruvate dehydrogenase complex